MCLLNAEALFFSMHQFRAGRDSAHLHQQHQGTHPVVLIPLCQVERFLRP